ncbi:hypothetical protein FGO68_gene13646 [Halteria grandinella]|uniref:Uncharacterized protein n=1 Tax=Halteria grandinella TaxID=5974 RepID=A0A8J8NCU3_HALGN|nr:hypothetical protein FGO68_gene13646 [Halteria grandinella]
MPIQQWALSALISGIAWRACDRYTSERRLLTAQYSSLYSPMQIYQPGSNWAGLSINLHEWCNIPLKLVRFMSKVTQYQLLNFPFFFIPLRKYLTQIERRHSAAYFQKINHQPSHLEKMHKINKRGQLLAIDREFWLRSTLVCSRIGLLQLLCGLFLYFYTIPYLGKYNAYLGKCGHDNEKSAFFWIMVHSWFVLGTGTLVLLLFLCGIAIKLTAILSYVLCPLKFLKTQRCLSRKCRRELGLGIDQLGEMAAIGRTQRYEIPEEAADPANEIPEEFEAVRSKPGRSTINEEDDNPEEDQRAELHQD